MNKPDEPVAWISHHKGGDNLTWEQEEKHSTELYAHPALPSNLIKAAEDLLAHLYDPPNGQPPYEYVKALISEIEKVKS